MKKIITVIGARPQIIKAAAISRAIRNRFSDVVEEYIVHTGQHYDENMSEVFIRQLQIPQPHYNLGVGSAGHGIQTARMIEGIESVLLKEKPDGIILYGDTNSTLAGAVAASKIHLPVVHIEAGLRSFNKAMPEEINRIVCDHCSTLLFSPTLTGYNNLVREGFNPLAMPPYSVNNPKIYHCGDVMYDNSLFFAGVAAANSRILQSMGLEKGRYVLATIHRNGNTDVRERLESIFRAMLGLAAQTGRQVVVPLHPRTSKMLESQLSPVTYGRLQSQPEVMLIPPVSFLDMIALEESAALVLTDSGGVQKEAYFFRKPCVILRPETEWVEIVQAGAGKIADAGEADILRHSIEFLHTPPTHFPDFFGDGHASEFILEEMLRHI